MIFGCEVGPTASPSFQSTSCTFSPARAPVKTIGICDSSLPGQVDHLPGEIEDLHGLAHVEHVDLTAAAHRARLHDE